MNDRLQRNFFTIPTLQLAKNLLGCVFVRETEQGQLAGIITETEAYTESDPASHAYKGRQTKRNTAMFANGGYLYVYVSYGIHHCLNIVSEHAGKGCAVLIRAVQPTAGITTMQKNRDNKRVAALTDGPGKLCQAFNISLEHNGIDMVDIQSPIYITKRKDKPIIAAKKRVGITKGQEKLWRFVLAQ